MRPYWIRLVSQEKASVELVGSNGSFLVDLGINSQLHAPSQTLVMIAYDSFFGYRMIRS